MRREDGFTLIELLVGMSVGLVVLMGAFTLVDQAMPASGRVEARLNADRTGRNALEQTMQSLRNAVCVKQGVAPNEYFLTPFDATSTDSQVVFYAQQLAAPSGGSDPALSGSFTPEKRTLAISGGKLTETRVVGTQNGGGPSIWTFGGLASPRLLLNDLVQDGTTPYFTYYAYNATTGTLAPLTLAPGAPVGATDAPRVVQVGIAFRSRIDVKGVPTSGVDMTSRLQDTATVQLPIDFSTNATAAKGAQCTF